MFKLKSVKRIGTHPVKVLFSVEGMISVYINDLVNKCNHFSAVQTVHFPNAKDKDLTVGAPISVCFERGGKMVSSEDHLTTVVSKSGTKQDPAGKDLLAEVGETLRIVATLYRTDRNTYQEKTGKIVVRQRRQGETPKNLNAFKGIGTVKLQLHLLAKSFDPCKMTLALQQCATPGVIVNVIVVSKVLGDVEDDTMSQMSGMSDISCGAADFSESFGIHAGGLGGITEETDGELIGDERSPFIAGSISPRSSELDERSNVFDRPTELFDHQSISLDAFEVEASAYEQTGETSARLTSPLPRHGNKSLVEQVETGADKKCSVDNVSNASNGDKELLRLRGQLDQYVGDFSKMESKLATANMLVSAETKRSKKLKSELLETKKELDDFTHKINVLERSKVLADEKIKALEADNDRMKALLTNQKQMIESASEHEESQDVLKLALDRKVQLVKLEDQLADLTSDRDAYKSELEQTREELASLRYVLTSRGIKIHLTDALYEDDKEDLISALRSQLGSLQILADEEKEILERRLESANAKIEKMMLHSEAREVELQKAAVQALAVAKDAWGRERNILEIRLASTETDCREMIEEIDQLKRKIRDMEDKQSMDRGRSPSPVPAKSLDGGPPPMLRQLSKMASIKALTGVSSKHLSESDDTQRQIDALNATHSNAVSVLSKELDALRTKNSLLESELDNAEQEIQKSHYELKLTKMELWETLDKVDNVKVLQKPQEKRESLRKSVSNGDISGPLLDELIAAKMDFATLANLRDVDRLETFELKRRVQGYAERVAKLEVLLALSSEKAYSKTPR